MMKTLTDNIHVVEAITPSAGGSVLNGDWVTMKGCELCTVLVNINQGNAATVAVELEEAKDVSGTDAQAMAKDVPLYLVADAATSDTWVKQTDASDYTTTAAVKHKLVAFEVKAEDLTYGFDCLRVKATTSNAGNIIAANYLASGQRYTGASMITD